VSHSYTVIRRYLILLVASMLAAATTACTLALFSQPGAAPSATGGAAVPTALPAEMMAAANAEQQVLINLYERVNPSVVSIDVSVRSNGELTDVGAGSGFVYDDKGHVITNAHVGQGADELRVVFFDGMALVAKVVGTDPYADIAVLKVEAPVDYQLYPVEFGDSSQLQVGQTVVAIGNPFGLSNTMTRGIVSGVGRTLTSDVQSSGGVFSNPLIIQVDAPINPGNSGGPLLNLNGQVIGVNSAIRTDTGVNSGIGFAVPANTVKKAAPQIIENGKVEYPYLGISAQSQFSLAELSLEFDLPVREGVLVTSVVAGTPASRAGLRGGDRTENFRGAQITLGGDIITAIDGTPLHNFDDLLGYLVANTSVGQTVKLTVIRNNATIQVDVTLGPRPGN
jgi:S1-C subfamily serine protease